MIRNYQQNVIFICSCCAILLLCGYWTANRKVTKLVPQKERKKNETWWLKQKETKARIEQTCQKFNLTEGMHFRNSQMIHIPGLVLLYCENRKVGSTALIVQFGSVQGKHANPYALSESKTVSDIKKIIKSTFSFTFVRHPFERLVSAYKNKVLENANPDMTVDFCKQYGKNASFSNFTQWILEMSKLNCKTKLKCGLDIHWLPYYFTCGFCDTPYTVVGRLETFDEDLQFIQEMAGFQFGKPKSKAQVEKRKNKSKGESTASMTRKYFSQLDKELFDRVYELFKIDFEMFGYSPDI